MKEFLCIYFFLVIAFGLLNNIRNHNKILHTFHSRIIFYAVFPLAIFLLLLNATHYIFARDKNNSLRKDLYHALNNLWNY